MTTTYRVKGTALEDSVGAGHLIIAYKGDRAEPATLGQELGRATASAGGIWEITFEDWDREVIVVCFDMDTAVKYQAKLADYRFAISIGSAVASYKPFLALVGDDLGASHLWLMDDSSGSLTDSVGSATITLGGGAATYEVDSIDVEDKAIQFNATNTPTPTTISLSGQIVTVAFLMKSTTSAEPQAILGFGDAWASNGYQLYYSQAANAFGFNIFNAGDVYGIGSASTSVMDGDWHTVIAEFNGNDVSLCKLFVDGQQQTISQQVGVTTARTLLTKFSVGNSAGYVAGESSKSIYSRVAFFDKALTTNEINALHSALLTGYANTDVEKLTTGLVAYYNMQSIDGTQLKAVVGPDGTLTNAPTEVDGPFTVGGKALQFDGVDQYVANVGSVSDFSFIQNTGIFSVCAWIKLGDPEGDQTNLIMGNTAASAEKGSMFAFENRSIISSPHGFRAFICRGVHSSPIYDYIWNDSLPANDTEWRFVCFIGDGTDLKLYVDGVDMGAPDTNTKNLTFPTGDSNRVLNVGRLNYTSNNGYFEGSIDQLRVYDTNLSETQIQTLYNEGFSGVVYPEEVDPFFNYNEFLLHLEGVDGSTTFTDVMGNTTWTEVNSAQLDVDQSKFGSSSLLLDGTGDYITEGVIADWNWLHDGTEDYTFELFIRVTSASNDTLLDTGGGPTTNHGVLSRVNSDGSVIFYMFGGHASNLILELASAASVITAGTWHHIAICVEAGVGGELFVDGISRASATNLEANSSSDCLYPIRIGYYQSTAGYDFGGHIDEVRLTRGAIRYANNFLPPAEAYPDYRFTPGREPTILDPHFSKVALLHNFDGLDGEQTFTDQGPNNSTITTYLNAALATSTQQFGTASLFLNDPPGTGSHTIDTDHLQVDGDWMDWGTDDFTIEFWINTAQAYSDAVSTRILSRSENISLMILDSSGQIYCNGSVSSPINDSNWHHIVLQRRAGNTEVFVDGQLVAGSAADATNYSGTNLKIGVRNDYDRRSRFNGYIDDIRITRGIARYASGNFAVPTEAHPPFEYDPFENLAGVIYPEELDSYFDYRLAAFSFDGNYCNSSPIDMYGEPTSTGMLSSSQSALGSESFYVTSGTNQGFIIDNSQFPSNYLAEAGEDFTVELWYYHQATGDTSSRLFQTTNGDFYTGMTIVVDATPNVYPYVTQIGLTVWDALPSFSITSQQWTHICIQRKDGVIRVYKGGVQQGADYPYTHAVEFGHSGTQPGETIVGGQSIGPTRSINGYLSEFAVYKGITKYGFDGFTSPIVPMATSRFTPGTEATILDPYWDKVTTLISADLDISNSADNGSILTLGGGITNSTTEVAFGAGSIFFDGSDDYVSIASDCMYDSSFEITEPLTIELYIHPDLSTQSSIISSRIDPSSQPYGFVARLQTDGGLRVFGYKAANDSGLDYSTAAGVIKGDVWQHVAITFDGVDTWTTYVDGVQKATSSQSGTLITHSTGRDPRLGMDLSGAEQYTGYMDCVRITKEVRYTGDSFNCPEGSLPPYAFDPQEDVTDRATYPTEVDPYWDTVTLLINGEGEDIDLPIADLSDNRYATKQDTGTNNSTISNAQAKFGSNSIYSGNDGYVAFGSNHSNGTELALSPGTGDFTIEFWMNLTGDNSNYIYTHGFSTASKNLGVRFGNSGFGNRLSFYVGTDTTAEVYNTSHTRASLNGTGWHHVAWVRHNGFLRFYFDGIQETLANSTGFTYNITEVAHSLDIVSVTSLYFGGYQTYIDDIRISHVARYTENFTAPTEALPTAQFSPAEIQPEVLDPHWDNVRFLLGYDKCHGNSKFLNIKTGEEFVTVGDVSVSQTEESPLSPHSVEPGSGAAKANYFRNPVPGDTHYRMGGEIFTLDGWVQIRAVHGQEYPGVFRVTDNDSPHSPHWTFGTGPSRNLGVNVWSGSTWYDCGPSGATSLTLGQWYHFAVVKSGTGANDVKLYLNGVLDGTSTSNPADWDIANYANSIAIVGGGVVTNQYAGSLDGFIEDVRWTVGVARWTGNFTPPKRPNATSKIDPSIPATPTVARVEVDPDYAYVYSLMHFNGVDAGTDFWDETNKVTWTTPNSAALSDTEAKFGATSLDLTGANYLEGGAAADWEFLHNAEEDFSFEIWAYRTTATLGTIFDTTGGSDANIGVRLQVAADGTVHFDVARGTGGTFELELTSATGAAPDGEWCSYCVTYDKVADTYYLFVDGRLEDSGAGLGAPSSAAATNVMTIGAEAGGTNAFTGYVDEMRISRSVRHTERYFNQTQPYPSYRYLPDYRPTELQGGEVVGYWTFDRPEPDLTRITNQAPEYKRWVENKATSDAHDHKGGSVRLKAYGGADISPTAGRDGGYGMDLTGFCHLEIHNVCFSSGDDTTAVGARDFTIEAWVKYNGNAGSIFSQGSSGAGSSLGTLTDYVNGVQLYLSAGGSGHLRAGNLNNAGNSGFYAHDFAAGTFVSGKWQHVALVCESQVPKIFVDGKEVALTLVSGTWPATDFSNMRLYNPTPINIQSNAFEDNVAHGGLKVANTVEEDCFTAIDHIRITMDKALYFANDFVPRFGPHDYPDVDRKEDLSLLTVDPLADRVYSLCRYDEADGSTSTTDDNGSRSWTFSGTADIQDGGLRVYAAGDMIQTGEALRERFLHNESPFTVECKFILTANNVTQQILSSGGTDATRIGFSIGVHTDGKLYCRMANGTGTYQFEEFSNSVVQINRIYDACFVYDPAIGYAYMYLDGVLEARAELVGAPALGVANSSLTVGNDPAVTTSYLRGWTLQHRVTEAVRYKGEYTPPTDYLPLV